MPTLMDCKCGHHSKFPNPYEPWALCEDCLMTIGTEDAVRAVVLREFLLTDHLDHLVLDHLASHLHDAEGSHADVR